MSKMTKIKKIKKSSGTTKYAGPASRRKYIRVWLHRYQKENIMTQGGRILILVEELLFGYAVYVVLFDIYFGWWTYFTPDEYKNHLSRVIIVSVSLFFNFF